MSKPWTEYSFVAFDTETSGAYPLGADIVEVGLVKWANGKIIDEWQTLLKPRFAMSDFIVKIHGITNEMVALAPIMSEKIDQIHKFIDGSVLMAHHAPFDLGFLVVDLEKNNLPMPDSPIVCTSLLARKMIPESPNHKLQTLIKFLNLPQGAAHRALDDAKACLQVGFECFHRFPKGAPLEQIIKSMGKQIEWQKYAILGKQEPLFQSIVKAVNDHQDMDIIYEGGSLKGKTRRITPIGIVRNPDGDYVMAKCHIDHAQKRFYLDKILDAAVVFG